MSVVAKFPGTCPECGGRWFPGAPIRSGAGGWCHDVCPDDVSLAAPHPVCTTCWLTHPEGACDR